MTDKEKKAKEEEKKKKEKEAAKKKKKKIGSGYEAYNEGYENELYEEMVEDMGADYLNECSDEELKALLEERTGEGADEDTIDDFRDFLREQDEALYGAKQEPGEEKKPIESAAGAEGNVALNVKIVDYEGQTHESVVKNNDELLQILGIDQGGTLFGAFTNEFNRIEKLEISIGGGAESAPAGSMMDEDLLE